MICDLDALATLPPRELRCGRGEMAKYHFLTGDDLLAMDETERIARCVRDQGATWSPATSARGARPARTRLLNYGHTLAHALEIETEHALAHGEAVAIGLVYAARLARELGRIDDARVAAARRRRRRRVRPVDRAARRARPGARCSPLMGRDKKAIDGLTFVLDGTDGVEVVAGVPPDAARAALARMDVRA